MKNIIRIEDITYDISYFKAKEGIIKYTEFLYYVGDGFKELLSVFDFNNLDSKVDLGRIGDGLNMIIKNIYSKGNVDNFVIGMMSNTRVDDVLITKENFDELFTGKPSHIMEILIKVIEVNFKGFFPKVLTGMLQKATQTI